MCFIRPTLPHIRQKVKLSAQPFVTYTDDFCDFAFEVRRVVFLLERSIVDWDVTPDQICPPQLVGFCRDGLVRRKCEILIPCTRKQRDAREVLAVLPDELTDVVPFMRLYLYCTAHVVMKPRGVAIVGRTRYDPVPLCREDHLEELDSAEVPFDHRTGWSLHSELDHPFAIRLADTRPRVDLAELLEHELVFVGDNALEVPAGVMPVMSGRHPAKL